MMTRRFAAELGFFLALLCLTIFIYWSGLKGGFFFDDSINILESPWLKLEEISMDSLAGVLESGIAGPLARPISMLSFAINYYFSGFDPFYFKLFNLIIHCVNGMLVFLLVLLFGRAVEPSAVQKERQIRFAFVVAALWLLHPIQLTSILYVVQRMTSLMTTFVLAGLILHVLSRQQKQAGKVRWLLLMMAWGMFLPMAVLSKETGVLFFLYILAYEVILQRKFRGGFDRFSLSYISFIVFCVAVLIIYLFLPDVGLLRGYETRQFTMTQRLLTESRVVIDYIGLIVFPTLSRLSLYHDDFAISMGFFEPITTLVAMLVLVSLSIVCWATRSKYPLISFGLLWFIFGHSLESSIFPLELMHEHRNYLPSLGVIIVIAALFQSLSRLGGSLKIVAAALSLAVFTYFALLTYLRADMYGSDFRRTQMEADYRLGSVRAQYEAGALLVNSYSSQPNQLLSSLAEKYFQRVNMLDPDYKLALIGQLQLDCLSEKKARIEIFDELRARLAGSKWTPQDRAVMRGIAEMSNAGTICLDRQKVDELFSVALGNQTATVHDRSVVRSDYVLYLWIGQEDYAAAREVLLTAIYENPDDLLNRINLLQLSRTLGDREGVFKSLRDLEGRSLSRLDRRLVQSVIDDLKANGVSYSSAF
jgi:protein O-mannosyl-transferase